MEAIDGDGRVSFRSWEFASSFRVRPPEPEDARVALTGLSSLSLAGCSSIGSSMSTVEDPPFRCSTLIFVAAQPKPAESIYLQAIEEGNEVEAEKTYRRENKTGHPVIYVYVRADTEAALRPPGRSTRCRESPRTRPPHCTAWRPKVPPRPHDEVRG